MSKGLELYAARESSHRRTWSVAAIILILVFFAIGDSFNYLCLEMFSITKLFGNNSWQAMFFELSVTFGIASLACFAWIKFFERRSLATIGFTAGGARLYGRGLL